MFVTDWTLPKIVDTEAADGESLFATMDAVKTYKPDLQGEFYFEESPSMPSTKYTRWLTTQSPYTGGMQFVHDIRMVNRGVIAGDNALSADRGLSIRRSFDSNDFDYENALMWVGTNTGALALVSSPVYGGSGAARVTPTTGQRARIFSTTYATPSAGDPPKRAVAYVYSTVTTRARIFMRNSSSANTVVSQAYQDVPANTWTRLQYVFNHTTAQGNLAMGVECETANQIIFVDHMWFDNYHMEAFGSNSNLFGAGSLRREDVTRSDFGIAIKLLQKNSSSVVTETSAYLKLTGFNLSIPRGATVRGFEVRLYAARIPEFIPPEYPFHVGIYFAQIRAHYDWSPELIGESSSFGHIEFENQPEVEISDKKTYQYNAYRRGVFMGEWDDVMSSPDMIETVNAIPGEMNVVLARNLDTVQVEMDDLLVAGYGENQALLTADRDEIMVQFDGVRGIGDGTDAGLNYDVDIIEYYGGYESLLTAPDSEELLTADGEPLLIQIGHPSGRRHYSGWVSKFGLRYKNGDSATRVKLLHHGDEMNNIMFETNDVAVVENNPNDDWRRIGAFVSADFSTDVIHAQTFTVGSSTKLSQIVLSLARWGFDTTPESEWPTATLQLKVGAPNGSGAIIAESVVKVPSINRTEVSFPFDVTLNASTQYSWLLHVPEIGNKYSSPVRTYLGGAYANGVAWVRTAIYTIGSGRTPQYTWSQLTGQDFAFKLYRRGGETTVSKNSMSPTQIFRDIVDFGRTRGSRLTYTPSSVAEAGTVVSIRFNANYYIEAVNAVLRSTPSDWYWYLDAGKNEMYLQPRPTNVTQYFTRGDDVEELLLDYTLEALVNEVYFTGGGTPALFRRLADGTSQGQWRRGLDRMSDNRVTDPGTASIMMESQIERYNQPLWAGTARIIRRNHPQHVRPGELSQFLNFHPMISALQLQIMAVKTTKTHYDLELGLLLPRVSKRVEDIKRNLDRIEAENNPNAPA